MGVFLTGEITRLHIILGALAGLIILIVVKHTIRIPKGLRLPPGPRGRPIFGNASDMPTHHEWETFTQWAKDFGNLVHVKVFGRDIVLVNTLDLAHELFEKRSSLYSDRMSCPMLNDLMGFDWNMGFMHYGKRWNRHRTAFYKYTHPTAAVAYHETQTKQARSLLRKLHDSPDQFIQHLHHMAGASIMEIVYGIKVLPVGDRYIDLGEKAITAMSEAAIPGTFLVDFLPMLKYVPEWMPGAGFRRKARIWRGPITEMSVAPFLAVKEALNAGTARPSLTASLLEELSHLTDAPADEEEIIQNTAGVAYLAGAHSTATALHWFILAMLRYPETQRKAQMELDFVIGPDRLPEFEDRKKLPYVNALCKEVLRWYPVAPVGVGHRVTQDDAYREYFIPEGSIIIGNVWAMLRDEKTYGPNPEHFEPERFLRPEVGDPTPAFGFGRRFEICPGRFIADNAIFISVASILAAFNIDPARDVGGKPIAVELACTSGAICAPEPFQCAITPRSVSAKSLLREHADD